MKNMNFSSDNSNWIANKQQKPDTPGDTIDYCSWNPIWINRRENLLKKWNRCGDPDTPRFCCLFVFQREFSLEKFIVAYSKSEEYWYLITWNQAVKNTTASSRNVNASLWSKRFDFWQNFEIQKVFLFEKSS